MNEIETLEVKISKFLRAGVILSAILMLIGWIWEFEWKGHPFFHFQVYDKLPLQNQIFFNLRKGNWGNLFSYAGLALLISLPIIRVLMTGLLFLKNKEFILSFMALLVLLGLGVSFIFGIDL